MRKREFRTGFRVNENELAALTKKVKQSGMPRERYLRTLLLSHTPGETPKMDYPQLTSQLHNIGQNTNQIAACANATGYIDAIGYEANLKRFAAVISVISEAAGIPRNFEFSHQSSKDEER